jgi:hypothetical protein
MQFFNSCQCFFSGRRLADGGVDGSLLSVVLADAISPIAPANSAATEFLLDRTYIRSFYRSEPALLRVRRRNSAPVPIRLSPLSTAPPKSNPVFGSGGVELLLALPLPPADDPVALPPDSELGAALPVPVADPLVAPTALELPPLTPPAPDALAPLEPELSELCVVELVDACTTIVPFMNGWIAQM